MQAPRSAPVWSSRGVEPVNDRQGGSVLDELVERLREQMDAVRDALEALYGDLFVETAPAWLVPYVGELVELHVAHGSGSIEDLLRAVAERLEEDVRRVPPDWWPRGLTEEALAIRWKRGAAAAARDERFVDASYRVLRGPWRAFRGARVTREGYEAALRRAEPHLAALGDVTIADLELERHLEPLVALFRAVEDVKPTRAKWVATSKTLYFALPDLVPPIDNEITRPFLRASGVHLQNAVTRDAVRRAFSVLSGLARVAGADRLRRLNTAHGTSAGMARVVDFAIAGWRLRQQGRPGPRVPPPTLP